MRKILASLFLASLPAIALAQYSAGSWQTGSVHPLGFPVPQGPTALLMGNIYNIIFIIIAVAALVVALPICYVLWRFRRSNGRKPSTFSHSTLLELTWSIIPALICIFIMYISYQGMIQLRTMPANGVNVEAVAYQFGWDFYYPDASEAGTHVKAEAPTKPDEQLSHPGAERLVPELVVPIGKPIIMHVTSADVLHAFFNPYLGIKIDAIPGRINYAWFQADHPGTYLGQCAELCGSAHSEMFFKVRAVSDAEYADYIKARRVDAGLPAVHVGSPTAVVSGNTIVSGAVPLQPISATAPDTAPVISTNAAETKVVTATVKISETILPSTSNPKP
jgi:cytochrome c oxidase subunit 2